MRRGWAALASELPASLEERWSSSSPRDRWARRPASSPRGSASCACTSRTWRLPSPACRSARGARAQGLDPAACRLRVLAVRDERWAERWQEGLRAFPLGTRFAVHPPAGCRRDSRIARRSCSSPAAPSARGSTAPRVWRPEALERHVVPGSAWLDLGTGTGLLALVARHLAASAWWRGTTTGRRGGGARGAGGERGRGESISPGLDGGARARLVRRVVANIVAPFFLAHAAEVAALLRPGGVLLATGSWRRRRSQIARCWKVRACSVEERESAPPWILLARGSRPDGAALAGLARAGGGHRETRSSSTRTRRTTCCGCCACAAGEPLAIFDGAGREWDGTIAEAQALRSACVWRGAHRSGGGGVSVDASAGALPPRARGVGAGEGHRGRRARDPPRLLRTQRGAAALSGAPSALAAHRARGRQAERAAPPARRPGSAASPGGGGRPAGNADPPPPRRPAAGRHPAGAGSAGGGAGGRGRKGGSRRRRSTA
jgi:ribosomal protein L11 methyltransferase